MTTNKNYPGRSRRAANPAPDAVQAEIAEDYGAVVAEPVALGSVAAEQVGAKPVEVKAVAISITTALGELPSLTSPEAKKSDVEFDLSSWPLMTLDLFSANTATILDFATALAQAKSLSDAIELQSRFASERYSTLLRQTNEIAELMRRSIFDANAPVRLNLRAFVA